MQPPSKTKKLFCSHKIYQNIPFLREKIEVLHLEPTVVQAYDIISESRIERILLRAMPFMARSKVQGAVGEEPETHSSVRTSTTTWISESRDAPLHKLPLRVQMLTGLHILSPGSAEDLQVSSYGIGGHYNPHFDTLFDPAVHTLKS